MAYLLFFYNLGGIALWDPDEPRQAIMAVEMAARHDYIHPYLNGRPYLEKPPFYPWMINLASHMTGTVNEFASRMPAALSATFLVLVTYFLGCLLLDPWAGLAAGAVLATNYQFLSNARESVMDMTFAFFMGLAIALAYLALTRGRKWLFALAFLPSAFAILTKGPAGLLIPVCTLFIIMAVRKEVKVYLPHLALGCLLASAAASVWFLLAGEAYVREFIFRQNITRYTHAFDHVESFAYYFHKLLVNFLPWSLVFPFALYHGFRRRYWLPLVWFVFTFLFFEMSTSKRAIYLLSCYPACALLCGLYIRDKWPDLVGRPVTGILLKAFALILALVPVAGAAAVAYGPSRILEMMRSGPAGLYAYIAVIFAAGAAFFISLVLKREKPALAFLFTYLSAVGFFYGVWYMPFMDANFKSPRLLTDNAAPFAKNADVYTYGFSSAGVIYYIGKPVRAFTDIKEIKEDKRDILLILEDGPARCLRGDLDARFIPVGKARYEKEYYTFYVRKDGR